MVASVVILVLFALFPVSILASPQMTPSFYLSTIPYIEIGSMVIITPSSTFFVYLLGAITLYFGIRLFQQKDNQTKKLWGFSLMLWGIGTLLAGTSYQALGYELKCEGLPYCLFTSWFELSYLFVTAVSITVMAYAVSINTLAGSKRTVYLKIVTVGLIIYSLSLLVGVIFEIYFFITYEYFLLFFLPYFLSFFIMNIKGYQKNKNILDRGLIIVWLLMLVVNILYFVYLFSGIGESLYEHQQIWFSANDVLHLGLIYWMYDIYRVIKRVSF